MSDEFNPSAAEPSPPMEDPDAASQVAWTDGQLMRLENEWRQLQRSFAYHPVIGIKPLRGEPAYEYQIDYRVRSLLMTESGELQYVDEVSMHLWLPAGFPNQPPVMRPLVGIFHPNIIEEGVYLSQPWQPADTLVSFVARVGELLAFRDWDAQSVVNGIAMEWVAQNSQSLPVDAHADFSPFNGGEPLGRIQRMGPATLEKVRRSLDDMRFALLAEDAAPSAEEVADFAQQTGRTLGPFLDSDVPDNLRQPAREFDEWRRDLPASTPLWKYFRDQRSRASAAESAATSLKNAASAFSAALVELESLVKLPAELSPQQASQIIPSMDRLAPHQLKLPALGRDLEKWAAEANRLLDEMRAAPPDVAIAWNGSLGRRLTAQGETVKEAVASAARTAQEPVAAIDPLLRRAHAELAALAQVVAWREYIDMFSKARNLEKQVSDWGAAGVQAFFIENSGGSYGPFQFDEPLDLGAARIVVRGAQRGQVEVIDAIGQKLIGRGTDGKVTLAIDQGEGPVQTTIRVTERCDDLIVQFSFIQQHTAETMSQLQSPIIGAQSWCGAISAHLCAADQPQKLRDAHRKSSHRWKGLVADLVALERFKERLATHHFVQWMLEEVPRVAALIANNNAKHAASTKAIAAIMGKSSRDIESDRLIMPPNLVAKYVEELKKRDDISREAARLEGLLKQVARELSGRLGSPRLRGRSEIPALRAMAPLPEALASMSQVMSDGALTEAAAILSVHLGVKLSLNPPAASSVKTSAPPDPAPLQITPVPRASRSSPPTPQPEPLPQQSADERQSPPP